MVSLTLITLTRWILDLTLYQKLTLEVKQRSGAAAILPYLSWISLNERPPMPASCQPALAQLIKRCWAANPSKRPDFTYIVSALQKYDECVKEGLPMTLHSGLVSRNAILERLKGCVSMSSSSSIPVNV
ncbi:Serine/threonine-protein kinase HT1 [Capsicum chinense]|nr:Serine/threonine-protein kinase HT1 [Capsicum chinense]